MTKRMLIDDTQPEETRVVVINGNKLEDVEFETAHRKQIKGNIYLGKVMRVEPSLQAAFIDYGGNKHGFLAFGEIHPDYYNIPEKELAQIEKEVEDIVEGKKQALKDRELERERVREEKRQARIEAEKQQIEKVTEEASKHEETSSSAVVENSEEIAAEPVSEAEAEEESKKTKKRILKKRNRRQKVQKEEKDGLTVMSESAGTSDESISEEIDAEQEMEQKSRRFASEEDYDVEDADDDDDLEYDFEVQKKLLKARKLYHKSKIQDVIKEGQIVLVQIVKEERGNKGAALTTYLSLAGRYCVLMPNRIKSGGVSRKITNANDRKRLKSIVKELPLTSDMSIIVRTAGEEKTKSDIVRDYNYLIRSWNQIRINALSNKAPALIHEEGNLIKRALRDIYTKEVSEILVAGDEAFNVAKDFFRILSPHSLKKIKKYRNSDMPLFQRFQVEAQLDKLHESTAQLDSGGYLVINPTEALVAIDVNSGRATKEKDLEETALKTNLEACDEIARQLRMRNLAGLIVVDFIDMDEPSNNHAVERRMKEALKKDRSRIQIAKMSCFGLLEISRQRLHSSFMESNYIVCPHCHGQGVVRTVESGAVLILRSIEEEGIKNRSSQVNVFVPSEVAIYLLNQKRQNLIAIEERYKMNIIISADDSIKNIGDHKIERVKAVKNGGEEKKIQEPVVEEKVEAEEKIEIVEEVNNQPEKEGEKFNRHNNNRRDRDRDNRRGRRDRRDRDRDRDRDNRRDRRDDSRNEVRTENRPEKQEAVILYNSHGNTRQDNTPANIDDNDQNREKSTWWKKLIKG